MGSGSGVGPAARVKREVLAACMTCPLCKKLLRDATTISECLHTFCRKCIFEKLTEEEVDCCPICNIDLGCVPVEKLRPDHNLQDVRAKIFPFKRRKVDAPEILSSITLPVRRKERSLSSLVVNTPRVSSHTGLTGRRTKSVVRRASTLRGLSPVIDEPTKKQGNNVEDLAANASFPETGSKMAQNRRQNHSTAETSNQSSNKDTSNGGEYFSGKAELWKHLNCLVEAANRTKPLKSSPQSPVMKAEHGNGPDSEVQAQKAKVKEHLNKPKIQDEKNIPATSIIGKNRKLNRVSRKRKDLPVSAQALIDVAAATCERRICPIWLTLVPTFDQKGDTTLSQTSACYLRIKDVNLPVSFIQKYLVKKLNLASENEVEIACQGQSVSPTLPLHQLPALWVGPGPPQKLHASVGSSAKEFVMVLTYSRKTPAP